MIIGSYPEISGGWFGAGSNVWDWSTGSLKVAWNAGIHPLGAGAGAGRPEGPGSVSTRVFQNFWGNGNQRFLGTTFAPGRRETLRFAKKLRFLLSPGL